MYNYTICFIKQGNHVLMLNREKGAWMGRWNGVGGKIEEGETREQGVLREVKEETDLDLSAVIHKGDIEWVVDGKAYGGMHLFVADIPEQVSYPTPVKKEEGILDWKTCEWLLDEENMGVADIHDFLPQVLDGEGKKSFVYYYEGSTLVKVEEKQAVPDPV
ncbi:NUDIX hydrolase [Alteribacter aurantiacus]|uniref:NUDIX hydrolase n=1 Tax=Alteribacter aurantiacus TaxID=254410 RepID=UPI0004006984|nr:8-oxo-dGTP diphosphatase [Alteribacter aurantiacus]